MAKSPDKIAAEVRQELRSVIRQIADLRRPLDRFATDVARPIGTPRHYVEFDRDSRKSIQGLRCSVLSLNLYDERINKAVEVLAQTVWHLKDPLRQWAKAMSAGVDVEKEAEKSTDLLVVSDLANQSKHKANRNRSALQPELDLVRFDTSKSGVLEIYLDGAAKEKEVLVTFKHPIPFAVDVKIRGGKAVLGDAVSICEQAFKQWLPLIKILGILAGNDTETRRLREKLF